MTKQEHLFQLISELYYIDDVVKFDINNRVTHLGRN